MNRLLHAVLKFAGKSDQRVAAVFGQSPIACHQAVAYLRREQPDIPVWLFATTNPFPETAALCERVVVRHGAAPILYEAEISLWRRKVVLCVGIWNGDSGGWVLKIAPFAVPPFRALLLNRHGDFLPGEPIGVGRHVVRRIRDALHSSWNRARDLAPLHRRLWRSASCTRARDIACAVSLFAIASALQRLRYPQRRFFHRAVGGERLDVVGATDSRGNSTIEYRQTTENWQGKAVQAVIENSTARWLVFRRANSDDCIDDMLALFDDPRTFAVSRQSFARTWKPMLFATAPFRQLQPCEATHVLAPLGNTIVVSRDKLAKLGAPECGLIGTAWMLLFWKAAAAGWRCYSVGGSDAIEQEPELPVEETGFTLRVLRDAALRKLGPCEPELSRGNIAFEPRNVAAPRRHSDRLRVLVVSPYIPYPLSHGGAVRIMNLSRALSDRVEFSLIAVRESGDPVDYARLHDVFSDIRIVDLDHRPKRNSELPAPVRHYESPGLRAIVADCCRARRPDLLQVEYTQLAFLREEAPGVPAILVEHDFTAGLYRQLAEREPTARRWREYDGWLNYECRWLAEYEGVWTVSEEERDAVLRHSACLAERAFVIANGVDVARFRPLNGIHEQLEILYVGSFRHLPNLLGFERLCDEIMPLIWSKSPNVTLRVVAGPKHEQFRAAAGRGARRPLDSRIEILGYVEDLRPLYAQAAVVVAPLPVSSGTNIKVLEAMACAKPIVSTSVGCAGLEVEDGYDILINDDSAAFAGTVGSLLSNAELRLQIGTRARRTATERFDWTAVSRQAFASYLAVLEKRNVADVADGDLIRA